MVSPSIASHLDVEAIVAMCYLADLGIQPQVRPSISANSIAMMSFAE